jgi:hypothetical protein
VKLHTKYYRRFLWLCRLTGLAGHQMRAFIASIPPGEQKRLGDYTFKLLNTKQAGRDMLYNIEVRFAGASGNNYSNNSLRKSGGRLVLKSPLLIDAPRRSNKRHVRAAAG